MSRHLWYIFLALAICMLAISSTTGGVVACIAAILSILCVVMCVVCVELARSTSDTNSYRK